MLAAFVRLVDNVNLVLTVFVIITLKRYGEAEDGGSSNDTNNGKLIASEMLLTVSCRALCTSSILFALGGKVTSSNVSSKLMSIDTRMTDLLFGPRMSWEGDLIAFNVLYSVL